MQSISQENRQLFGKQVEDHIEKLNMLIGVEAGDALQGEVVQKAVLATKLLKGSASMIGMNEWSEVLGLFRSLLDNCVRTRRIWDDQLSQTVLDLLESEERVVANLYDGDCSEVTAGCSFDSLQKEIEFILSSPGETVDARDEIPPDHAEKEVFIEDGSPSQDSRLNVQEGSRDFSILEGLTSSAGSVRERLNSYPAEAGRQEEIAQYLKNDFGECEFFIGIISNIVKKMGREGSDSCTGVSSKIVTRGINDFFDFYQRAEGWKAELVISSHEFEIERKLASSLISILDNCIYDICSRYRNKLDFVLKVEMEIANRASYLIVDIRDNGPDSLSDSELAGEDAVAFYKGLMEVKNIIERTGGLLWVEPEEGEMTRFRFTIPKTERKTECCIVNSSGNQVAVPSCNIASILDIDDSRIGGDQGEQYVMVKGRKLPFYSLEELASGEVGAETSSSNLILAGLAERRIGILCGDDIKKEICLEEQFASGEWKGIADRTLHLDQREFPVLKMKKVLARADKLRRIGDELKEVGVCSGGVEK